MADPQNQQPIIIKRIKKGGGHHGGAWKVAYADFVTAMMAFFLLLWLLNVTPEEKLKALADYFDPTHPKVSDSSSGAGGVLGGLSMAPQGAMATATPSVSMAQPAKPSKSAQGYQKDDEKTGESESVEKAKEVLRKEEEARYKDAEQKIHQAIQDDPELAALSKNLLIDMTPEGLRIQIVDQENKAMFPSGSAQMYDATKHLMEKVGNIVKGLPNEVSIRGHTDSVPYGNDAGYTNWELSSDRANASRRVFLDSGLPPKRINNVMGKADTDPLVKEDPNDAKNRRISIILLREELTDPDFAKKAAAEAGQKTPDGAEDNNTAPAVPPLPAPSSFRKTPGQVEFP